MSELTFEQMLEESLKTIHTGEVVEGTVIDGFKLAIVHVITCLNIVSIFTFIFTYFK